MSESHVLDIRKKTVQERLRGDHIDLLYQLEDVMKLNDKYEKEIDDLKDQLNKVVKPEKKIVVVENDTVIECHLKMIEDLQKKEADLINDIKTLKTKEALIGQTHRTQLEALQKELDLRAASIAQMHSDYEVQIDDLQRKLLCYRPTSPVSNDSRVVNNNDKSIALLEKKCTDLEMQVRASKDIIAMHDKMMKENSASFQAELEKRSDVYKKQKDVILQLEGEKDELITSIADANEIIQDLKSRLINEQRNSAAMLATMTTHIDSTSLVQTVDSSTQTEKVESEEPATVNQFKDYIQLKKENMTLKLQLVDKESGKKANKGSRQVIDHSTANSLFPPPVKSSSSSTSSRKKKSL